MFERYTERARRALFFARYELTQLGGRTIVTEHILLSLLREPKGLVGKIFTKWNISLPDLRRQLEAHAPHGDRLPTSVEVPFNEATKRVLSFAAEEADRLLQRDIECEHLLLGLLREKDAFPATTLAGYGMNVDAVRAYIAAQAATASPTPGEEKGRSPAFDAAAHSLATTHIQRIMTLVRDLAQAEPNSEESRALIERIDDELMMLHALWR